MRNSTVELQVMEKQLKKDIVGLLRKINERDKADAVTVKTQSELDDDEKKLDQEIIAVLKEIAKQDRGMYGAANNQQAQSIANA